MSLFRSRPVRPGLDTRYPRADVVRAVLTATAAG